MATIKLTTENKIIKELEEKGFNNVTIKEGSKNIQIHVGSDRKVLLLFHIDEYQHCCGMREIGGLNMIFSSDISENLCVDLIIKHLKKGMEEQIDKIADTEDTTDQDTLGFSVTIPYEDLTYNKFLKAIERIGFKEVAEFKNKNSGNRLKHFIYIW